MPGNSLDIDRLSLRLPGMGREQAQRCGEDVVQQLATQLPASGRARHIETLRLRLTVPLGTSHHRLASMIARGIAKRIA